MNEVKLQWTLLSGNIWITHDVKRHPERLLKDDVELLRAETMSEFTSRPEIFNWYYPAEADTILYLYSTQSPENSKISINNIWSPLAVINKEYVTIRDIELQGGYNRGLHLEGNYIDVINVTVGKYAYVGIKTEPASHIRVDSCIVDAHFTLDYSMAGIGASTERGSQDGLLILNTHDSEFRNSYFKNWGHASIGLVGVYAGTDVYNNRIHHNFLTSPDIAYGGRIGWGGEWCYQNEIFCNIIQNISVRNQPNGRDNHFHHNIIDGVRHSPLVSFPAGQGINLQASTSLDSADSPVYGNIYENNLIMNTDGAGIVISGFNIHGDVYENVFRNNLVFNCGLSDAFSEEENTTILVSKDFNACCQSRDNIFQNNLAFNESGKTWVVFREDTLDCKQFNTLNGRDGYVITDNICGNPLFVDPPRNFHLLPNSPCIDAGILPKAKFDFDGFPIPFGAAANIGIYEYAKPPKLLTPQDDTTGVSANPTLFEWTSLYNATSYQLQISKIDSFSAAEIDTTTIDSSDSSVEVYGLLDSTTYHWRVRATSRNKMTGENRMTEWSDTFSFATEPPTSVEQNDGKFPKEFALLQNYPNPFNPTTIIKYQIAKASQVKLVIVNLLGQRVATLVDKFLPAGFYSAQWEGKDESGKLVASGVYIYQLQTKEFVKSRKLVLIR